MEFKDKVIVIISQSDWGDMFISKNHYAVALSKLGNKVYFVNGPDRKGELKPGEIKIEPTAYNNLFVVKHCFSFPYIIVFKARALFNILVRKHINRILKKMPIQNNLIVWSFDMSNTMPLKFFPKRSFKIYMPVDEPRAKVAFDAAETAQAIFSVTKEIVDKYKYLGVPSLFTNHGVADIFINEEPTAATNNPVVAALSGNFLRPDIDRETLLHIIKQNSAVIFNCWGSTTELSKNAKGKLNSSLGGDTTDPATRTFISEMAQQPNVVMHGSVPPSLLSAELHRSDIFLICYDINKDQSGGTNYHKVLEYLACGKVTVSNNITTYQAHRNLIQMTDSRTDNNELAALFASTVNNLSLYNNTERQHERIAFAKQYLYSSQVKKIESFLNDNVR